MLTPTLSGMAAIAVADPKCASIEALEIAIHAVDIIDPADFEMVEEEYARRTGMDWTPPEYY